MSTKDFVKVWMVTGVFALVTIASASYVTVQSLEAATVKQCAEHAWPAHADKVHREWCVDNGYKI